jgi:hypothetical protein
MIDNDFHPLDQLKNDADHGHWGTESQINRESKTNRGSKKVMDRYGDNAADLPTNREDNEYEYNRTRK